MITKISKNSKRGQKWLMAYNTSNWFTVKNAYKSPSTCKIIADNNCRDMYRAENGVSYRIIYASTYTFTAAWTLPDGSLRVETKNGSYIIQ